MAHPITNIIKYNYFAEPTISSMVTELSPSIKDIKDNATKDFYQISNIRIISGNETRQGNRTCPTGMLRKIIFGLLSYIIYIRFQP